jgi:hypothetical protein
MDMLSGVILMRIANIYGLTANLLLFLHFLYVSFVVAGQASVLLGWALRWHWVRNLVFRLTHLAAICAVAVLDLMNKPCPLTIWEYQLREKAGQTAKWEMTFVEQLMRSVVFCDCPAWFFEVIYIGLAVLVILTFVLFPPRWKKRPH